MSRVSSFLDSGPGVRGAPQTPDRVGVETEAEATAWLAEHEADPAEAGYPRCMSHLPGIHPLRTRIDRVMDAANRLREEDRRARSEERRQAEEQAEAQAKADRDRLDAVWIDWAKARGGDLARAAAAGYAITIGVVDDVVAQLSGDAECTKIREGSPEWDLYAWDLRNSPRAKALDLAEEIGKRAKAAALPEGLTIGEALVCRVTREATDSDDEERYTAVVVRLESPLTRERALIFRCE